ncbi:MAG TPA: tyrosine-type recombinase/integrase [Gemmatimonadaceae bacterium]|nr:tyrosine-type recombinase/integrase [Gemmatimonadaceae bacterium]
MYRRPGRPNLYAKLRTETGWTSLCLVTPNRSLAGRMETMWETLATSHRAWDLLNPVIDGERNIGALYDLWVSTKGKVDDIRERLNDEPLAPHVEEFLAAYASGGRVAGSVQNVTTQLRWLIPVDSPMTKSQATAVYLTKRLAKYPGGRNTRRKVHTSWSVFFKYCTTVAKLYAITPMTNVERPKRYKPLPMFYEAEDVGRIVTAASSPSMRAVLALMYGTGIEVSIAIAFRKRDFRELVHSDSVYGEVRAPGTKEHTRDRVCIIAAWAWPIVKAYMEPLQPADRLWPGMYRTSPEHAHRRIVKALGLDPRYPLYNSRHHWAATRLRAGMPLELVQKQLGHASPRTTLEDYGQFVPTGADRVMWEQRAGVTLVVLQ